MCVSASSPHEELRVFFRPGLARQKHLQLGKGFAWGLSSTTLLPRSPRGLLAWPPDPQRRERSVTTAVGKPSAPRPAEGWHPAPRPGRQAQLVRVVCGEVLCLWGLLPRGGVFSVQGVSLPTARHSCCRSQGPRTPGTSLRPGVPDWLRHGALQGQMDAQTGGDATHAPGGCGEVYDSGGGGLGGEQGGPNA